MPFINGFNIYKQDGSLSCWVATARSVLDFYAEGAVGGHDGLAQKELVSLFSKGGQLTGDPERILSAAGALRNSEKFSGDETALNQAPRIFLRIMDSVGRGEPVIVNLRPAGGNTIGHALVVYGYTYAGKLIQMKDPGRPGTDIEASLNDVMLSFAPYFDIDYGTLRFYAEKFIFTQKPESWRARRVALPGLYKQL